MRVAGKEGSEEAGASGQCVPGLEPWNELSDSRTEAAASERAGWRLLPPVFGCRERRWRQEPPGGVFQGLSPGIKGNQVASGIS